MLLEKKWKERKKERKILKAILKYVWKLLLFLISIQKIYSFWYYKGFEAFDWSINQSKEIFAPFILIDQLNNSKL